MCDVDGWTFGRLERKEYRTIRVDEVLEEMKKKLVMEQFEKIKVAFPL